MPQHIKGESQSDWMSRCVPVVMKEGKTKEQAVGQCEGMWKQHMTKNELQTFTINVRGDMVREDTLEGEEYWVAPLVMMTECVANGSQGPLMYTAEELEKWTPAWNYKPIVTPSHPTSGSACTKEFLDSHKIGVVLNANWDGKQRAFGWFNKQQTRRIEPRVANALQTGRMMELSTGLYVDPEGVPGEFKGEKYVAFAKNHRPDHLAILPDKIGACSIEKGAGLLQLNELSHEDIRMELEEVICEKHMEDMKAFPNLYHPYVRKVFDTSFIYSFGGNLYQADYKKSDDGVMVVGSPTQVEMKEEYVPVENVHNVLGEETMTKTEMIDKIIKNTERTAYEEPDRKHLETLDEKRLAKIVALADVKKPEVSFNSTKEYEEAVAKTIRENKEKEDKAKKDQEAADLAKNQQNPPEVKLTPEQWMAAVPPEMREVHNEMVQAYQGEKARLITTITANKANQFKPEDLAKMGLPLLRNMAALATPADQQQTNATGGNFLFAAPLPTQNAAPQTAVLSVPVYNVEKLARQKV